jgi:tRNA-specific 2-thiouridylase
MKIAVAMSGGVDSSVVANMLVSEGHEVIGLFLKLWSDSKCTINRDNRCCDYEALEDARKVANQLGVPFYVINATEAFREAVVDNFLDEYQKLNTPNPCIVCNDKIKFDLLLKKALALGCEKLATGHYARIASISPKSKVQSPKKGGPGLGTLDLGLFTGLDETKDQSYMLYRLNQNQLQKVLFPLGEMKKKEVRELAKKWDLPVKEKPESQEICFISDDYRSFLKRYFPQSAFKSGDIVDMEGNAVGKHLGLINYTIGQRKGINQVQSQKSKVQSSEDSKPLYVIGFNEKNNQLIVGEDEETYQTEMTVGDLNWISSDYRSSSFCHPEQSEGSQNSSASSQTNILVKIRYRHDAVKISQISNLKSQRGSSKLRVLFKEPQRAVTPGQSAVFYLGDQVLGGGIILK